MYPHDIYLPTGFLITNGVSVDKLWIGYKVLTLKLSTDKLNYQRLFCWKITNGYKVFGHQNYQRAILITNGFSVSIYQRGRW